MFEGLSGRFGDIFDRLRRRGALSEEDVSVALREVRVALLEADVALPVVKDFVAQVRKRAVGQDVLRSVTPGQQVIKIVHDELVAMLGGDAAKPAEPTHPSEARLPLNLNAVPPVPILLAGLQGSGKTTTAAKIGLRLTAREHKKVLLASLDVRRPAAQEQLRVLGEQVGVDSLPIVKGQQPLEITRRALESARLRGFDVVILDTAGRLAIDRELMDEVKAVAEVARPSETLLVADAMTGQDAVGVAEAFHRELALTGIVLTRVDGDSRGGAALSMRAVTGRPIKMIGVGEKPEALEAFHADRIANRILGMGDVVSLVEKAAETIEKDEAEKLARKMQKGSFDLEDMASQLRQMRKMGGLGGVLGMLPGVGKLKTQLKDANVDDGMLKRQEAIILSMTPGERRNPKVIHASRKKRIAAGSGTSVQDVNRLLKQHQQMADMMKRMKKMGKKGMMKGLPPGGGLPGDLPPGLMPPGGFKP
jgi:signal recognition particle subunit SRP54